MRMWFLVEIVRLGLHLRNEVLADDRDRHGPVRIEIDLDDPAVDVRRRPGPACRRPRCGATPRRRPRSPRCWAAGMLQTTKRGAEIAAHAAQPHQHWCAAARAATCGRHVQRLERLLADDAVDRQAVARLEAAHRRLDIGVEDVGHAAARRRDRRRASGAGAARSTVGLRDCRAAAAATCRHRRPAAARRRCPRSARSPASVCLRGRGRQRRQRRLRHLDGARGGIEALAEIAALRVCSISDSSSGVLGRTREARENARPTPAATMPRMKDAPAVPRRDVDCRRRCHRNPCPSLRAPAPFRRAPAGRAALGADHAGRSDRASMRRRAVAAIEYGRRWAIL